MPLRVVRRKGTRILWITGTIEGRRIRESTGTDNPELAEIKRADREARLFKDAVAGLRPSVPFSRAVESYLSFESRGAAQVRIVTRLATVLGTRLARDIDQADADRARAMLCPSNAAPATIIRHVVSPLTSVLRHAARRGWCERPELQWPRVKPTRFSFLLPDQAEVLIGHAVPHLKPIITFMLCTGARTGETLRLDWMDVDLAGAKATFWEGETKTGARRLVSLPPRAVATLACLPRREGRVFLRDDGLPFTLRADGGGALRSGWATACRLAGLPGRERPKQPGRSPAASGAFRPDHTPHSCRHTFATWHYAVHRDLLLLARDVGWASTTMAERYAHIMPEGYQTRIRRFWGLRETGTNLAQSKRRKLEAG